ncbi:unnamed protein product [Pedinophyceae sp. YPF-701]|nr:unnamed protein product [Pedinophyceae sp. YPF-701]
MLKRRAATRRKDALGGASISSWTDITKAVSSPNMIERRFSNGDTYIGDWSDGQPHGSGTYSWKDGAKYVGDWHEGEKHGEGEYIWPSGARYKGDWWHGCMHGVGTYTTPGGGVYEGSWALDLKHGLGKKVFENGDVYSGLWREGQPHGPGTYKWASGNEYAGDWAGGQMNGYGTYVWSTGEKYDGEWLDGKEHGEGVFTRPDGSQFEGLWFYGQKHGIGIYRPPPEHRFEKDPQERAEGIEGVGRVTRVARASRASRASSEDEVSQAHGSPVSPSRRRRKSVHHTVAPTPKGRELSPSAELAERSASDAVPSAVRDPPDVDLTTDGGAALRRGLHRTTQAGGPTLAGGRVVVRQYNMGTLLHERQMPARSVPKVVKIRRKHRRQVARQNAGDVPTQGIQIYKGHSSWSLMCSLKVGVLYSVGGNVQQRFVPRLEPRHFTEKTKVLFPKRGSQVTPPHSGQDFKWKDYAPAVFQKLRECFDINPSDYLVSLCGAEALRELRTPGKSGSVFFLSSDLRYFVKTVSAVEYSLLMEMLPQYTEHVRHYPNTLICKFFGLHSVKPDGGKKVRFVVMGNLFNTDLKIHTRYDLKGSTHGRFTKNPTATSTLKDLDLTESYVLEPRWQERLLHQLERDTEFLARMNIMDYSLLLGVHSDGPHSGGPLTLNRVSPQGSLPSGVDRGTSTRVPSMTAASVVTGAGAERDMPRTTAGTFEPPTPAGNREVMQSWTRPRRDPSLVTRHGQPSESDVLSPTTPTRGPAGRASLEFSHTKTMAAQAQELPLWPGDPMHWSLADATNEEDLARLLDDIGFHRWRKKKGLWNKMRRNYQVQRLPQGATAVPAQANGPVSGKVGDRATRTGGEDTRHSALQGTTAARQSMLDSRSKKMLMPAAQQDAPAVRPNGPRNEYADGDVFLPRGEMLATDMLNLDLGYTSVRLGNNMTAVAVDAKGAVLGPVVLYMGVIDILQTYRTRKKLEHLFKSMVSDGNKISVIHPRKYAKRFMESMRKTFPVSIPGVQAPLMPMDTLLTQGSIALHSRFTAAAASPGANGAPVGFQTVAGTVQKDARESSGASHLQDLDESQDETQTPQKPETQRGRRSPALAIELPGGGAGNKQALRAV